MAAREFISMCHSARLRRGRAVLLSVSIRLGALCREQPLTSEKEPNRLLFYAVAELYALRQYIFILVGQMEIGIGDGTTRQFGPGDVVLADDLTGKGHTTRSVGVPRISATVPVGA